MENKPQAFPNIAGWKIRKSPFSIGKYIFMFSFIFQPAMLVYQSVFLLGSQIFQKLATRSRNQTIPSLGCRPLLDLSRPGAHMSITDIQ